MDMHGCDTGTDIPNKETHEKIRTWFLITPEVSETCLPEQLQPCVGPYCELQTSANEWSPAINIPLEAGDRPGPIVESRA